MSVGPALFLSFGAKNALPLTDDTACAGVIIKTSPSKHIQNRRDINSGNTILRKEGLHSVGQTITEKILSKACGHDVQPGEIINAKVDRLMTMDWKCHAVFGYLERELGGVIRDPEMLVMVSDHLSVGHTVKNAQILEVFRQKAKQYGVSHFYGVGRTGICHQVMVADGLAAPGKVCLGTDSHSTTYGALSAFSCGVSTTEAAVILATGQIWLRVPETIRVRLTGTLPFGCYGKDVALRIIGELKCDQAALYRAIEFCGEGIASLDMDDRIAICNMMAETGAKNALFPVDGVTRAYLHDHSGQADTTLYSDEDAEYVQTLTICLDDLVPMIAVPPNVWDVRPVAELEGTRITRAFLGSCTSGRLAELGLVARMFHGRAIDPETVMVVVPASNVIHAQCAERGYIQDYVRAGCAFESASCACCAGFHTGLLPDDAVCISTTNRNLTGRMGSKKAQVFLASAATVGASALTGVITDPRPLLRQMEKGGGSHA